jgi:hypothetical protein
MLVEHLVSVPENLVDSIAKLLRSFRPTLYWRGTEIDTVHFTRVIVLVPYPFNPARKARDPSTV